MRINELVLYNQPGSIQGSRPFIRPEAVEKIVKMGSVYVGVRPATMPIITIWTENPNDNPESAELIGTAHLDDDFINGFVRILTPSIPEKNYRGKGYGILFYEYVLDVLKENLQSDDIQTPGSALIWARLARNPKYKVYGVSKDGSKVPVIADGIRLFVGDQTVYDSPIIEVLRCERK